MEESMEMSKKIKTCYFKCNHDGYLYRFPPLSYLSYEKYCQWKKVLRKQDQENNDTFIIQNYRLCKKHFDDCFITVTNRLTKNAIPTLNIGPTSKQEELLCAFIERNPEVLKDYGECNALQNIEDKWKILESKLNKVGTARSYEEWAQYLTEVKSNLKIKKVIWAKNHNPDTPLVSNADEFTDLELRMLQIWIKEANAHDSDDCSETHLEDGDYELMDDDGHSANSNEIVTFTLNIADSNEPLLQVENITPYVPQRNSLNLRCKCKHSHNEILDEFDTFGKDVAEQLRNMPEEAAIEAQNIIMSVLHKSRVVRK